jgi:polysaccharide biosynthesis/export protein
LIRRLLLLAVLSLSLLAGCGYQDFQRPPIRWYFDDLFFTQERPPEEEVRAKVRTEEEIRKSLEQWEQTVSQQREAYLVGPGDVLRVNVSVLPEENKETGNPNAPAGLEISVDREGKIRVPFLGVVPVGGLSTAAIEEKLFKLYSDGYYRNPTINVMVTTYNSRQVAMVGAVSKVGVVALKKNRATLLEVLLEAGGVTTGAGTEVVITRVRGSAEGGVLPESETIKANLQELFMGTDLTQNIVVEPGDIVNVLPASPNVFYVYGYADSPGKFEFPRTGSVGMLDAVAYADGLTVSARPENSYLIRTTPEGKKRYRVDLIRVSKGQDPDIYLKPNDAVVIGTSWPRRIVDATFGSIGAAAGGAGP